jgi:hypothetical protein
MVWRLELSKLSFMRKTIIPTVISKAGYIKPIAVHKKYEKFT